MLSPIFNAFQQADLFGKFIFLSLFICSLVTWVIILKKIKVQKKVHQNGLLFAAPFQKKRINPISVALKESKTAFQRLFCAFQNEAFRFLKKNTYESEGMSHSYLSSSDLELVEEQVAISISKEIRGLEKNLFVLSTIVSLAPFLGLLGTVWGILLTFFELQAAGGHIQSSDAMLGGLAMALATTVVGLIVAIPALLGYNYLKNNLNHISQEMEDFGQTLLCGLKEYYREESK